MKLIVNPDDLDQKIIPDLTHLEQLEIMFLKDHDLKKVAVYALENGIKVVCSYGNVELPFVHPNS